MVFIFGRHYDGTCGRMDGVQDNKTCHRHDTWRMVNVPSIRVKFASVSGLLRARYKLNMTHVKTERWKSTREATNWSSITTIGTYYSDHKGRAMRYNGRPLSNSSATVKNGVKNKCVKKKPTNKWTRISLWTNKKKCLNSKNVVLKLLIF